MRSLSFLPLVYFFLRHNYRMYSTKMSIYTKKEKGEVQKTANPHPGDGGKGVGSMGRAPQGLAILGFQIWDNPQMGPLHFHHPTSPA